MSNRPRPLAGQTVVITGAGSGIGRALAIRLTRVGCPLALIDRDADGLDATVASLSTNTIAEVLDVSDRQAQQAFAAKVAQWRPTPIGAVFNNAGVALSSTVADGSVEDEEWLHAINFGGVVGGVRAYLPILLDQDSGTMVNTSSVFGLAGIPGQSAYCASKFAVRGFTESLRHELAATGVRAVTVHPGGVRTGIVRHGRMHHDPRGLSRTAAQIAEDFERNVRTTPERAAEVIHEGVDAGKARILIGADARVIDALTRLAPTHYWRLLDRLQNLLARERS